jgi:hypothetical protein
MVNKIQKARRRMKLNGVISQITGKTRTAIIRGIIDGERNGEVLSQLTEFREFKNRLFMNVPTTGIFIFDNQGNFIQKVDLQIDQRMCFYKEHLFWVDGENLKMYAISSMAVTDLGLIPATGIETVQIGREIITFVEKGRILVYALPVELKRLK